MDWAYEKADRITHFLWSHFTGSEAAFIARDAFAQALRDVQRETALECYKIVGDHTMVEDAQEAILERFGLKEKS